MLWVPSELEGSSYALKWPPLHVNSRACAPQHYTQHSCCWGPSRDRSGKALRSQRCTPWSRQLHWWPCPKLSAASAWLDQPHIFVGLDFFLQHNRRWDSPEFDLLWPERRRLVNKWSCLLFCLNSFFKLKKSRGSVLIITIAVFASNFPLRNNVPLEVEWEVFFYCLTWLFSR